ncbi:MAG: YwmB family TATA-box binding protein [Bacillota bacterium]|nr:YwmB family TATA-box binding protein [Bacillota bacterium]
MKKIFSYILVFAVLCVAIDTMIDFSLGQQIKNQSPYELAFASTGANLLESRMDCWAKINSNPNEEAMEEILCEILTCLELPINRSRFLQEKDNEQTIISYEIDDLSQWHHLQVRYHNENGETHFLMSSVSSQDDLKQRRFEKILQKEMELTTYYRYTGMIKERSTPEGRNKLIDLIFKSLIAEKVDHYQDLFLTAGTGYSKDLEVYGQVLNIAGKKVNVQVGIKCADSDENTRIYLGFPLLLNDY